MSFGENTLPEPLEIESAREAAHRASEVQREVEDALKRASGQLAEKERLYRKALAEEIMRLHAQEQVAWSACSELARGNPHVADLRYARDVAEGILEATRQQAFRRGAERRDLDTLLNWSMRRDLRTDAEPASPRQWAEHQRPVAA